MLPGTPLCGPKQGLPNGPSIMNRFHETQILVLADEHSRRDRASGGVDALAYYEGSGANSHGV